jgi:hypothetical protein
MCSKQSADANMPDEFIASFVAPKLIIFDARRQNSVLGTPIPDLVKFAEGAFVNVRCTVSLQQRKTLQKQKLRYFHHVSHA